MSNLEAGAVLFSGGAGAPSLVPALCATAAAQSLVSPPLLPPAACPPAGTPPVLSLPGTLLLFQVGDAGTAPRKYPAAQESATAIATTFSHYARGTRREKQVFSPFSMRPPFTSSKHWHCSQWHSGSGSAALQLQEAVTLGFQQWNASVQERRMTCWRDKGKRERVSK